MKKILHYVTIFLLISTSLQAQLNLELLSQYDLGGGLNDIWGYVDPGGREYALVGKIQGTAILDLSDPTNPQEVYTIPGGSSTWRDIKVYGEYAYVVDDAAGEGLVIIDMTGAPTQYSHIYFTDIPEGGSISTCHNIFIDEAQGIAYLFGCGNGAIADGAIMLDLTNDPMSPELVGIYDENYVHDGFVRNDTMWTSEVFAGQLAVVDIVDKANPVVMATRTTSGSFTHNCWVSDDGKTVYTTDEISSGFIDAYDVSDLSNIVETDRIQSNPGSGVIPHNTFVVGDYLVTSYYTDGVTIHDATNPNVLVEVGNYDTSPNFVGNGFNGCWGVYPYLPSGIVIAADIQEGFFALQPVYQRACYAKVNVKDAETNAPLANAIVNITGTNNTSSTLFDGISNLGIATAGTYTIDVNKTGYSSNTAEIILENGETTEITVLLQPTSAFAYNFTIVDPAGNPIPNAQANFKTGLDNLTGVSNEEGVVLMSDFYGATFEVAIGAWGYLPYYASALEIGEANNGQVFMLSEGYYDDFAINLGWEVSGDATAGIWERGNPVGTDYQGGLFNPENDNGDDFGTECFVTGNGGGQAGSDDVDNGTTILTSPVFDLSDYQDPYLSFNHWFANGGGQGDPLDDNLVARLSNGLESIDFLNVDASTPMSQWLFQNIKITDYITPTENMTISFITGDSPASGHLVEAAIDVFSIVDSMSVEEPTFAVTGQIKDEAGQPLEDIMISISNSEGAFSLSTDNTGNFLMDLPAGEYNVVVGQWGYITQELDAITIDESAIDPLSITLEEGYQDDFSLDFGWSITGDANNGLWERGIPEGTNQDNIEYNPANDLSDDIGDNCYVTGLAGGGVNDNDVDNGATMLTSPVFDLDSYENPYISFSRWFANGGNGADDEFVVQISNGDDTYFFDAVGTTDPDNHNWSWTNIRVLDYVVPSSNMTISFIASDDSDDHIVEAAIDGFSVADSMAIENNTSLSDIYDWSIQARPNPFKNILILELKDAEELLNQNEAVEVVLYNLLGKAITTQVFEEEKIILETSDLSSGVYFYSIQTKGQILQTGRVIKK